MVTPSAISASSRGSVWRNSSSSLAARVAPTVASDAAAGARDLLVARAGEPHFEFARAVAGVDEMGVAVDQSRRDPAAVAVDDARPVAPSGGQIGLRADEGDAAAARRDRAALDDAEARPLGGERRQTRVEPNRFRPRRAARVGHGVRFVSSLAPRFNV